MLVQGLAQNELNKYFQNKYLEFTSLSLNELTVQYSEKYFNCKVFYLYQTLDENSSKCSKLCLVDQ